MIRFIIDYFRKLLNRFKNGGPSDSSEDIAPSSQSIQTEAGSQQTGTADAGFPRRRPRRRKRRSASSEGRRHSADGTVISSEMEEDLDSDLRAAQGPPWSLSDFDVAPVEDKTRFHDLDLPPEIMHAIQDLGFEYCTPVQAAILPKALEGADAAARAQTGTGKTAVFLLTILSHALRKPPPSGRRPGAPRALILAPTRELAIQIEKDARSLGKYMRCKFVSVFGGMDYLKQRRLLTDQMVDVVVATPGRLLDFRQQGDVNLGKVEILVIDEADRMLDMGFIPDVQRIIQYTPSKTKRQTMLFSATLTPEVTRFSSQWTRDPILVEIEPEQVAVDSVEQLVYITTIDEKFTLLYNMITLQNLDRVIVFGNRRDQTRRLVEEFRRYGIICALLSGEVDQKKRIQTLEDFRAGKIRVLVATDVAARGLHVEGVSAVVNYNLPMDPEDYVHRIGRTGRAGASGISVSFASEDDSFQIPSIEKYIGRPLNCIHPDEKWLKTPPPPEPLLPRHTPLPRSSVPYRHRRGAKNK